MDPLFWIPDRYCCCLSCQAKVGHYVMTSYEPLHHKYRPQTFAELVGQEAIAATLTNALRQQKIAPAYLFTGARGTGKTSSARILAKSLNCLQVQQPTESPCGVCDVCRTITNGSALDIIEIDAASNTGVDNIRELIERSQFAPVQCRYKVYVIDECHMLSTAAFNALLKTLEEPPAHVVFVLATTDPQRVLPTIISRCQRFDFRRIPLGAMVQHLTRIAAQEAIPIQPEAVTLVAQIAQGGLRDAESLLDQLSLVSGEISPDHVWDLVGSVPERDLMSLLEAIAANDPEATIDLTRRLMDRGREPLVVLQNLASFYRDLLIAKTAPARSDLVAMTPPTWQQLCEFAQRVELGLILASQQHLRSAELQLKNTTQPRLWLEVTLMGLLRSAIVGIPPSAPTALPMPPTPTQPSVPPHSTPSPRSQARATTPEGTPSEKAPVAPPRSQPTPPEPTVIPSPMASPPVAEVAIHLSDTWQEVLKYVQPPSSQMLLRQQGCLLALSPVEAQIGIIQQWYNSAKTKVANLEAAFKQALGRSVTVKIQVASPDEIKAARSGGTETPTTSSPPSVPSLDPIPPVPLASRPTSFEPPASAPPAFTLEPPSAPIAPDDRWPAEDDVTVAARRLADFFAGEVVNLEAGSVMAVDSTSLETPSTAGPHALPSTIWEASSPEEEEEEDDDDIPF